MKRRGLTILCCILLMLSLAGCGREAPYRVDTVVRIPVDPTDVSAVQTEDSTVIPAETEENTEAVTEEASEESTEETKTSGGGKPSSGGNKKPSGSKETEPPQTQPPATEPPATEPDTTESPMTEPELTEPNEPEETQPVLTEPEESHPEETEGSYDPSDYAVGSLEYAILAEINRYRAEAGVPELTLCTRLSGIAAIRAEEVSRVWSHNRPDGRYYTSVMSDNGYGFSVSAENLVYASGTGDAAAMVGKWMSAENKDNLLNPGFTTAGVGIYRADGVTYVSNILIG